MEITNEKKELESFLLVSYGRQATWIAKSDLGLVAAH
jgi:hypothetical protein